MKTYDYCIDNWVRSTFSSTKLGEQVIFTMSISHSHKVSNQNEHFPPQKPLFHTHLPPEKSEETLKYWNSQRKGIAVELEFEIQSDGIIFILFCFSSVECFNMNCYPVLQISQKNTWTMEIYFSNTKNTLLPFLTIRLLC